MRHSGESTVGMVLAHTFTGMSLKNKHPADTKPEGKYRSRIYFRIECGMQFGTKYQMKTLLEIVIELEHNLESVAHLGQDS